MQTDRRPSGPLKQGALREDGYIFSRYYKGKSGNVLEQWLHPMTFRRQRISILVCEARRRAREAGVPFAIDAEYLAGLFPSDGKCPALGITLTWGDASGRGTSPSVDRIEPSLGYVVGNVQWLSNKANTIKSNATVAEICAVADYLKETRNA